MTTRNALIIAAAIIVAGYAHGIAQMPPGAPGNNRGPDNPSSVQVWGNGSVTLPMGVWNCMQVDRVPTVLEPPKQ